MKICKIRTKSFITLFPEWVGLDRRHRVLRLHGQRGQWGRPHPQSNPSCKCTTVLKMNGDTYSGNKHFVLFTFIFVS
jgi:hypothetical protein